MVVVLVLPLIAVLSRDRAPSDLPQCPKRRVGRHPEVAKTGRLGCMLPKAGPEPKSLADFSMLEKEPARSVVLWDR